MAFPTEGQDEADWIEELVSSERALPDYIRLALDELFKDQAAYHFRFCPVTCKLFNSCVFTNINESETENLKLGMSELAEFVGPEATDRYYDAAINATLPSFFSGFLWIYCEGARLTLLKLLPQIFAIALANPTEVGPAPLEWTESRMEALAARTVPYVRSWIDRACEDPRETHKDGRQDIFNHVELPRFVTMEPASYAPYVESTQFQWLDEMQSQAMRDEYASDYMGFMQRGIKDCVLRFVLAYAKDPRQGAMASAPLAPDTSIPPPKPSLFNPFAVSEDGVNVSFQGQAYVLSPAQARMMKVLYQAFMRGQPNVPKEKLLENDSSQVRHTWKGSPLWPKLIGSNRKREHDRKVLHQDSRSRCP